MRTFLLLLLLTGCLAPTDVVGQLLLTGRVTDAKGRALPGANVFVKGTYDGANADSTGAFRFATARTDSITLVATYVGYESYTKSIQPAGPALTIAIRLTELASELNTVVITAGAFEASDERRMTMLKPLDIVTTAGAQADIAAAMNLLPGAQRVGEQEGLFVRGGSNLETKVVIDGMIVQNPFFSALPDVQSRGRFQPFLFKGTSFSTGGYSAQYGQALSSVLLLNTTDKGSNNGLSLGVNLAGAGATFDRANDRSSLSATVNYTNLRPLFTLVRQQIDWQRVPDGLGGSLTYRLKTGKTGLLKVYGMYSHGRLGMTFRDPEQAGGRTALALRNDNVFLTSTYTNAWADGRWLLNAGLSFSDDADAQTIAGQNVDRGSRRVQSRAVLTRLLGGGSTLLVGAELHGLTLRMRAFDNTYGQRDTYAATFVESEIYLTRQLAVRAGLRSEYNARIDRSNLAPRLSMAYKTGPYSQVSLAAGQFYQMPDYRYLYRNPTLTYERADHLVLNYQRIRNGRTVRVETFYKNYAALVREFTSPPGEPVRYDPNPFRFPWGQTTNGGSGYAQGFDLFWRDQKTIKGLDYWLTYSYVDTKRLFGQQPVRATPTFVSNHNVSLITRHYVSKLKTNVGATYTFSSGRPYYNPNNPVFLADRTPAVHLVSVTASQLTSVDKNLLILYVTVDNLLNTRNVFTYRYTADGTTRYAVGPQAYRSFFVGGIFMLSKKAQVKASDL